MKIIRVSGLVVVLLFVALVVPLAAQGPYTPPPSNRASIALSGSWKFIKGDVAGSELPTFDDSAWSTVTVPHTWNAIDGQDGPDVGGDPFGRLYYRGVGSYRRHISLPATHAGRKLYLQFDGASVVADVWVNGISIGRHEGGFTSFRFDVTSVFNTAPGNDNVIVVKVNNQNSMSIAPISGDFTVFGGLYRDVSLVATDQLSADMQDFGSPGVYLSQTTVSQASATVEIKTLIHNGNAGGRTFTVKSVVVDAASNVVKTAATSTTVPGSGRNAVIQNVTIASPHLWDGVNDPYLYAVHVEIREGDETGPVKDVVPAQPLGLRYFSLDPNQGFFLNGRYFDLHGVNKHQDRLNKGWAISQSDQDQDMALIKEIGATAVRLAHYPHSQYTYGLANRHGFVVWAELPVVNQVGNLAFSANARQQLTELIRQSYNHPSIVFWSIANEVVFNVGPDPVPLLTELNALAKQEDPYRITTLAHCCAIDTHPTTTVTDVVGYNKYYGWYDGSYQFFGGWADSTHKLMPTRAIAVSEYGAGASIALHAENPPVSFSNHTEEYQALVHEANWLAMKTRPYLWGKFVWNMFDFASDPRNEGDTPGRNDKGLVTFDRQTRKDAFYWYKANWTTAPMVYITSRRWIQRTVPITEIKIYSNADAVELLVNGVSLGTITARGDRIFKWLAVTLGNGANTVQAIARTGATTVTDTVSWTVGTPSNVPPTIVTPANATPATVTGTSTALSILGSDDEGESNLTYTWSTTAAPAPVSFSINGSNAAKNTVASFARAGSHSFQVIVRDPGGRTATSSVTVTVSQTLTTVTVSPSSAIVLVNATQQFTASAVDQFATAMSAQPAFTWTASGGGTITSSGLFTAGGAAGSGFTVSATAAGRSGSAAVSVSLPGAFNANVNFQPAAAPIVSGYALDDGAAYGYRGNGLTYGWSQDNTLMSRDRNNAASPDQRYDTLVHMGALTWEIAIPNGSYNVRAVVGDPTYIDVNAKLTIEGVLAINGLTGPGAVWLQGTVTVTVTDGRLTVGNLAGSYNKICFLEIASAGSVNRPPVVSIGSPASGATFLAPASVGIVANASDPDGVVTKVEFFDGTTKLGEDANGADGWSLTWSNVTSGAHTLTARATDNAAATTTSFPIVITVTDVVAMRIDVGSASGFTDSTGRVWQRDQFGAGGIVSIKPDAIGGTVDDDLYRTYRYGTFGYDIPVSNGTYDVSLAMIETWWSGPGQRLFSVSAEGETKLANLDLYAAGGKFNAIDRTFTVVVSDGVLNLSFTSSIDNAIVSAIAIAKRP